MALEAVKFEPSMDSFVGAALGVLRALGEEFEPDEVWGHSGLAFRTQVHHTLAPDGLFPRQWDRTYTKVMERLGYGAMAGLRDFFYTEDDISYLRSGWRRNIGLHLEQGIPAIAYGLHGPAFGIIHGLDESGQRYLVSTRFDGHLDEPVHFNDLGIQDPPRVFVLIPTGPLPGYDRKQAARAVLGEAARLLAGREPDEAAEAAAPPPDLALGLDAFEAWAEALDVRRVIPPWGAAYTAAYYMEARGQAAAFLRRSAQSWTEAKDALESAAERLEAQGQALEELAKLFPLREPQALEDAGRRRAARECLNRARAAQAVAQKHLQALPG